MNQILFSVIGFLMFAIVGIGAAEVKIQMVENSHVANQEVETAAIEDVSNEMRSETVRESGSSIKTSTATEISTPPTTVPEALSQVVRTVSTALTSDWGDVSSSRREDSEWEDEEEYEDEDEDEGEHRSTQAATAPKTTPATTQNTQPQPTTPTTTTAPSVTAFTMTQVSSHNSAASCYTQVDGVVYDVTSYVSKHPGGQTAIKSICGVDGTAAFSGQHGGQGKPSSVLAQFKIGVIQ